MVNETNETNGTNFLKKASEYAIPTNFKTWNPDEVVEYFSMAIFSKRGSGKTVLLTNVIYHLRKRFDIVYIFSDTARFQEIYNFIPRSNMIQGFNTEILDNLVEKRRQLCLKEFSKTNDKNFLKKLPNILFLFDDVITDTKVRYSKEFNALFAEGRHIGITVVIISQKITSIPPTVRINADVVISFMLPNETERETFAKEYLSLDHHRVGQQILKQITSVEFQALVAYIRKHFTRYGDYVYTYKASDKIPKFKIGSESTEVVDVSTKQDDYEIPFVIENNYNYNFNFNL